MTKLVLLLLPLAMLCGGCGGSRNSASTPVQNQNPAPAIASLSPSSLPAGSPAQTLAINGNDFLSSTTVTFNGTARRATLVSVAQVTIALSTADVSTAGTVPVTATNPVPGGGTATVNFTVTAVNPPPTISALSPAMVNAGAASQTLTVTGTGFVSSSRVSYNGAAHVSTYQSSTQLTIPLTQSDLATPGSYPIVVTNPAPGGGGSQSAYFPVWANITLSSGGVTVHYPPQLIEAGTSGDANSIQLRSSSKPLLLAGGGLSPGTTEQDYSTDGYEITVTSTSYNTSSFDIATWAASVDPYDQLSSQSTLAVDGMTAYQVVFSGGLTEGAPLVVIPKNGTVYTISFDSTFLPSSSDEQAGLSVFGSIVNGLTF